MAVKLAFLLSSLALLAWAFRRAFLASAYAPMVTVPCGLCTDGKMQMSTDWIFSAEETCVYCGGTGSKTRPNGWWMARRASAFLLLYCSFFASVLLWP